jgi:hypothetical protein
MRFQIREGGGTCNFFKNKKKKKNEGLFTINEKEFGMMRYVCCMYIA